VGGRGLGVQLQQTLSFERCMHALTLLMTSGLEVTPADRKAVSPNARARASPPAYRRQRGQKRVPQAMLQHMRADQRTVEHKPEAQQRACVTARKQTGNRWLSWPRNVASECTSVRTVRWGDGCRR